MVCVTVYACVCLNVCACVTVCEKFWGNHVSKKPSLQHTPPHPGPRVVSVAAMGFREGGSRFWSVAMRKEKSLRGLRVWGSVVGAEKEKV